MLIDYKKSFRMNRRVKINCLKEIYSLRMIYYDVKIESINY